MIDPRFSTLVRRRRIGVLLMCVMASQPVASAGIFRKVDRQRLIIAKLSGKKTEMLLIAARPGQNGK